MFDDDRWLASLKNSPIKHRDEATKSRVGPGEEPSIDWIIELLTHNQEAKGSLVAKYIFPVGGAAFGFGFGFFLNAMMRKPLYTGIHQHVLGAIIGGAIGHGIRMQDERNVNQRYAFMLDYAQKHPERFPPPPNHTYAEVFEPWTPIR